MSATVLFYIIIGIIMLNFLLDKWLSSLNAKHFRDKIPEELNDVYDSFEYHNSQEYKLTNYNFGIVTSVVSIIATLLFFFLDGFEYVDNIARSYSEHPIIIALIFFGIIMLASDILSTPFAYYKTFVIEERFGFNKTTRKTFIFDKIKGWILSAIIGGGILAGIIWFY
ncbi:MAG: M48 family peptidase, partial [Bacteroidia bacterium]|nr:M48 family peptidase [Bacteroidia bacterium]